MDGIRPKVFISYKREHEPTAHATQLIENALRSNNFDVLKDTDIDPGNRWSGELYTWLLECSAAVAIVGKEASQSEWCRREWWFLRERYINTGIVVIPVCVDDDVETAGILDDLQALFVDDNIGSAVVHALREVHAVRPTAKDYLAAHHAWLRWQYNEAPVLGHAPFSLRDIYVETECGILDWEQTTAISGYKDPFIDDSLHGGRRSLVTSVEDLLADSEFRELIVVQGSPGSGKSAFTIRLVNQLLDEGLAPILVRFRDLRLATFDRVDELIEDALRIGPIDEHAPRPTESIITRDSLDHTIEFHQTSICEFVFVLDGWDEVSLTGNTSYKAQLQSWLPKIREFFVGRPGRPVRLILTGRPSVDLQNSGVLKKKSRLLTIRNMDPTSVLDFAQRVSDRLTSTPGKSTDWDWSLDITKVEPLFNQYRTWYNTPDYKRVASQSMDVLGNPLLALLTFRTLSEWEGDAFDLVAQPTALYNALVDITFRHSGKGQGQTLESTVQRGGDMLGRLLRRVASIITILGRESVSFTELKYRLEDDESLRRWYSGDGIEDWFDDATKGSALHELIVNFYFKGGNAALGCEFLHKSFREYLYAEAIVELLNDISEGKTGALEPPNIQYWQDFPDTAIQYRASRALSSLLAPQWFTEEVRNHVFWLIERAAAREPQRWLWIRDLVCDVYVWWAEGIHLRPQPKMNRGQKVWSRPYINKIVEQALPFDADADCEPMRGTSIDAHLGDALVQITAYVHASLAETPPASEFRDTIRFKYQICDEDFVKFAPGASGSFRQISARIAAAEWRPGGDFPTGVVLRNVLLRNDDCSLLYMRWGDFRGCDFDSATLFGSDLAGADLAGANLEGADLSGSNLTGANLAGANLINACLERASLKDANLVNAVLTRAYLEGANLENAVLQGADLTDTYLKSANFEGANIEDANLDRAYIINSLITPRQLRSAASIDQIRDGS